MKWKISLEEARSSLTEQIKERLSENNFTYCFEEHGQENVCVSLVSGQQMSCVNVTMDDDEHLLFGISIVNVMDFEVCAADLTLESLDRIREAIPYPNVYMDIWAVDNQAKCESHTLLLCRLLSKMPTPYEAIDFLRDYIPCDWMEATTFGENRYIYYPDAMDKEHFLIASFH